MLSGSIQGFRILCRNLEAKTKFDPLCGTATEEPARQLLPAGPEAFSELTFCCVLHRVFNLNVQQIFVQATFVCHGFYRSFHAYYRITSTLSGIRPQIPEAFDKDRLYGATIKNILIQSFIRYASGYYAANDKSFITVVDISLISTYDFWRR